MKSKYPWAQPLNIKPSDLESWKIEAPSAESFIYWCLDHGKIRAQDYFAWATNHYGLAVLKDEYFKQKPNRKLWTLIQSVANWSPSMLPLEEWDGVIFIGCVEPPVEVSWSFPVQYVLASPRGLKSRWSEFHNKAEDTTSITGGTSVTPAPVVQATPPPPPPKKKPSKPPKAEKREVVEKPSIELKLDELAPPELPPAPTVAASADEPPALDGPMGLDLKLPPLPKEEKLADLEAGLPAAADEPPALDGPMGLDLDLDPKFASQTGSLQIELPEIPSVKDFPSMKDISEKTPYPELPKVAAEAPAEVPLVAKAVPPPKARGKSSSAGGVVDTEAVLPGKLEDAKAEDEIFAWAFHQLKSHFSTSMVLLSEGGSALRPYRWEKVWKTEIKGQAPTVDPSAPSPFRIVLRSKQPYHGPIVENDLVKDFFRTWGFKKSLPAHMTLCPIMVGEQMIGMLLGIGEASANTQQCLTLAIRTAERLAEALAKWQSKAA